MFRFQSGDSIDHRLLVALAGTPESIDNSMRRAGSNQFILIKVITKKQQVDNDRIIHSDTNQS